MSLFTIHCPTCQARLNVRSAAAIGQILSCPRCQSMVQVEPPAEWNDPNAAAAVDESAHSEPEPIDSAESVATLPRAAKILWIVLASVGLCLVGIGAGAAAWHWSSGRAESKSHQVDAENVAENNMAIEKPVAEIPEPESQVAVDPVPADEIKEPVAEPAVTPAESEPTAVIDAPPVVAASPDPVLVRPEDLPSEQRAADDAARLRLREPVSRLEYRDARLDSVLETLASLAGAEFELDRDAMAEAGVSPKARVTFAAEQTTVASVLETMLAEQHLALVVEHSDLLVTSAARGNLWKASYEVGDLATAASADAVAGLVRKFVVPVSWSEAGGRGTLRIDGTKLQIMNHRHALSGCNDFLRRLRIARTEAVANPQAARLGPLASSWRRAAPALTAKVTLQITEPTPATIVVDRLASSVGTPLRVDALTLENVGRDPQQTVTLTAQDEPLVTVLVRLLSELEWGLWPDAEGRLVVGSLMAADRRLTIEFHPVGDVLAPDLTVQALLERLVSEVEPTRWPSRGGSGVVYFDEPSRTLIVLQSPAMQRHVERWLGELKGGTQAVAASPEVAQP